MSTWLAAALDYIPRWIAHQMRQHDQPGCTLAVTHKGKLLAEHAFGHADREKGELLTPRHRFRVASHSKTFTATAVMKLREQGRWGLDDPIGRYVPGLQAEVAAATLAQLLSHTAGLVRDGRDSGQWADRRPFLDEAEMRADLQAGPVLPAGTRFKYSNHGYGLLGLAIEAVAGEPYTAWVAREVVAKSGLTETTPDAPLMPAGVPFARGHSTKWPLGGRVVIPGLNDTHALASATGFVSTAGDLARFFGSLSPQAKKSVLSVASRREMTRRQWRDPHASLERWYGLGTISGSVGEWDWFGHSGGFQGTITRTVCVPAQDLSISVLTNAADGLSHTFVDGALQVLRAYQRHGAPSRRTAPWTGRWWSLWNAVDLLPMADNKVLLANPGLPNPLLDAPEIELTAPTRAGVSHGRIAVAGGFGDHGEPVALVHDAKGKAKFLQLAGGRLLNEADAARELKSRYGA
jgi:D-alanyl-D-alanine carboxypeptidase